MKMKKVSLAALPLTSFKSHQRKDGTHVVTLYGGLIKYRQQCHMVDDEVKKLRIALENGHTNDGLEIRETDYRIVKNKLAATVAATFIVALNGIEYTVRFFKDLVVITVGHCKVFFRPSKKLVVLPHEYADIIDEELASELTVVII